MELHRNSDRGELVARAGLGEAGGKVVEYQLLMADAGQYQ